MQEEDINKNPENQENKSEEPKGFDMSAFNEWSEKAVGKKFDDEGSLKNMFESVDGYESSIKAKDEEIESNRVYKDKYETFLQKVPQILPDADTIALKQLKDKYQDVDLGTLSQVRNADLNSMDNLSALVLASKVEVKSNASDASRVKQILKQLGVENEVGEFTDDDWFAVDNAFAGKKSVLDEIRLFQPEGADFDFEKEYQTIQDAKKVDADQKVADAATLKSHNEKMIKPILDGFKELNIPFKDEQGEDAGLKYVVDDKFKSEFTDEAVAELTSQGFKITSENAQEAADYINKEYIVRNFNHIMDSVIRQAKGQDTEKFHKEVHSDSPENKIEAPISGKKELPKTVREHLRDSMSNEQK